MKSRNCFPCCAYRVIRCVTSWAMCWACRKSKKESTRLRRSGFRWVLICKTSRINTKSLWGIHGWVWDSVPLEAFVLCMFVRLHLYRCRWIIDCSGRCSHYIDLVIEPNSRSWSTTFWAMVGSFERVIPFSLQVHPTRWNDSVNQPDSPAASFVSIGSAEWSKPRKSKLFFLDWNAANAVCAINSQSLFDAAFSGSVWCIRRELWSVSIFTPVDSNRSDWYRNRNTERRLDFVVCSVCSFYMFV